MAILSVYFSQNRKKVNLQNVTEKFELITNRYLQKSKYHLADYQRNDTINNELDFLKTCVSDPKWDLCIYSGCHFSNTFIMYPFLLRIYPDHDIRIIESCSHSCVVDMTTKLIYDLAMWNEIYEKTTNRENKKTIIQILIDTIPTDSPLNAYDFHTKLDLCENKFLISWL